MKAARLTGINKFEIVETEIGEPQSGEVQIKVEACGLCTSEIPVWNGYLAHYPFDNGFPGHELFGTVIKKSSDVKTLEIGDKVTAIKFPGEGYCEYLNIKEYNAIKLKPDSDIILGEPISCAINAIERADIQPGQSVMVLGCGFMGLLLVKLLKDKGCKPLIASSLRDFSVQKAKEYGADITIYPKENVKKRIKEITSSEGVDMVIESAGTQSALDLATDLIKIRGKLIVVGYHAGHRTINMGKWNYKGFDVINAHERADERYVEGMKKAVRLIESGELDFDLITHKYKLEEINEAFKLMENKPEDFIKGIIVP